jgi:hypothetical protein
MKIVATAVLLLIVSALSAQSPTIRLLEKVGVPFTFTKDGPARQLQVLCDAPRGNIVYLASGILEHSGGGWGSPSIAVAVIHQPDVCK